MAFTDRQIQRMKPKEKRYEVMDAGRRGFGIRVTPAGVKTWFYLYKTNETAGKKRRRLNLGHYPEMTLSQARAAYEAVKQKKERGIDPAQEADNNRIMEDQADTIKSLADRYLKSIEGKRKSYYQIKRAIDKDILPLWRNKKAKDISKRAVNELLDTIYERGSPIQANRTLALVRRLFNWAISRDIVIYNPCQGIEAPSKEKQRDRVLSSSEIKVLWDKLQYCNIAKQIELVMKLQLVTLQRKGECVEAERTEIDLESKVWTIPAHKSKNGLAHRVPLSNIAVDVIHEALSLKDKSKWLFPSPAFVVQDRAMGAASVNHALRDNLELLGIKNITPHDLRRTGASFMTSMGIPRFTVSKILNHTDKDVTAVYDRHSYDAEKKQALDLWATKLKEIIYGEEALGNVVKLPS